ncbi:hypothetical protein FHG87_015788 [Trinorchestia longiramus]|nr:hypothetical protein FHG87_015788 [Trinorchestia longiramus]
MAGPGRGGAQARNLQPSLSTSTPTTSTTWDHLQYAKCSSHRNLHQHHEEQLRLPWHASHLPQSGPCTCQITAWNSNSPLQTTSSEYGRFPRGASISSAHVVYWPMQRPSNDPQVPYRNHSLNL